MRAPAMFRQSDVKRAIKAAVAAGLRVARIEVAPDGRIVIIPGNAQDGEAAIQDMNANPWDGAA